MRRVAARLAVAAALASAASAASAEGGAEIVSAEHRDRFRQCRAAIFYHLEPDAAYRALPRAFAETMLEQYSFVMYETITAADPQNLDAQRSALAFVESFFLNFGAVLARDAALLRDVETRERILIDCQTFLWPIMKLRIDALVAWRSKAIDAPPLPPLFAEELRALRSRQAP
jgi:hypothetical protein